MTGQDAFAEVQRLLAIEEAQGGDFLYTMALVDGVWTVIRVNRETGVQDSVEFDPAAHFPENQPQQPVPNDHTEPEPAALTDGDIEGGAMLPGMTAAPQDDIPQIEPRDGLDDEDDDDDETPDHGEVGDGEGCYVSLMPLVSLHWTNQFSYA